MATRSNKIFIPNEVYFITFTILGWQPIFINDKYRDLIFKWFDYMKQNYNNKIHGYVIMPNHIHVLLKITDQSPKISTLVQNAKRFLAYQIVALLKDDHQDRILESFAAAAKISTGAHHRVFQDRYASLIITSQNFFLEKLNYIHNNPCTKYWHLAACPEHYPYSSASNYISGHGVYDVELIDF